MVLVSFLIVGTVAGFVANRILGENGYALFGEITLGVLGASVSGMLAGVVVGSRGTSLVGICASSAGAVAVLGVVVALTLRARSSESDLREARLAERADLEELRTEGHRLVLASVGVLALGLIVISVDPAQPVTWLAPAELLAVIAAASVELRRGLRTSVFILLAGLSLALFSQLWVYPQAELLYLYALITMLAGVLLGPSWGLIWAGLASVLGILASLSPASMPPQIMWLAFLLVWGSAALSFLASRPVYTALAWSWSSYLQARSKTVDLQEHQRELAKALKGLSEAYYRLERANEELDRARAAATDARRLKSQFAANVSHELRTPLNLIIGFSETMIAAPQVYGDEALPPIYRGDIDAIYRSAQHLSRLIDDILDLGQIEAGRMGLSKEPSVIERIIDEAVAVVRKRIENKGLDLVIDVPYGLPPVNVDPTRIRQILINLIGNAVRFTDQGHIRISVSRNDGELVVGVSDTGVGMSGQDADAIFQEFSQLEDPRGRQNDGSGLGLAISKRFVELHGGSIWVVSSPGQGSTFYFTLPLVDSIISVPLRSEWETWARVEHTGQSSQLVGVIAENARALGLYRRYLEGYQVLAVSDVEQAKTVIGEKTVSAVIMSGSRDWLESGVLQEAREAFPGVAILACALSGAAAVTREFGVADYLIKPVSRETLLGVLESLGPAVRRVAVIDDEPELVTLIQRMLESARGRFEALSACGGEEGLALVREHRPDAVILDLMMPTVDGYSVLAHLRADDSLKDTPVVVVTAKGYEEETVLGEVTCVTQGEGLSIDLLMRCVRRSLDTLVAPASSLESSTEPPTPVP